MRKKSFRQRLVDAIHARYPQSRVVFDLNDREGYVNLIVVDPSFDGALERGEVNSLLQENIKVIEAAMSDSEMANIMVGSLPMGTNQYLEFLEKFTKKHRINEDL